jgi:hypothetical protein
MITIGSEVFNTKVALTSFVTSNIKRIGETDSIKQTDSIFYTFLLEFIKRHPSYNTFGEVVDIKCKINAMKSGLELIVVGNELFTISRQTCINGKYKDTTTKSLIKI